MTRRMKNKTITKYHIIQYPTRMDIAGGFLDIWPISALIPDCFVINCSIPIWTSVKWSIHSSFASHETKKIHIHTQSPKASRSYHFNNIRNILSTHNPGLALLKTHIQYWIKQDSSLINKHFVLHLQSKSPVGAGLGASSSLCMCLSKMFSKLTKQSMSKLDQVLLCRDIETSVLRTPAGTQDYIPALYSQSGFLYTISYAKAGDIQWKKKKLPKEFFNNHILLIDTQSVHHSGQSNWKTYKQIIDGNKTLMQGLYKLRDNALQTLRICEREDWSALGTILKKEYVLRKTIFTGWLNRKAETICNQLMKEGAVVKLCGAGNGGAAIVFTKNKKQKKPYSGVMFKTKNTNFAIWNVTKIYY